MQTYDTTYTVYFSPTHTSQRVARAIGDGVGMGRRIEIDLTLDRGDAPIEINNALVIVAVPVYAGRVAPVAMQRLRRLRGSNAPAVLAVVYGNRDYEDALIELRDAAGRLGFTPLSAAAFVGEHSYSRPAMPIAAGRPDEADLSLAADFGRRSWQKLLGSPAAGLAPLFVKGSVPYRTVAPSTPAAPVSTGDCGGCGHCVELCPTGAIGLTEQGRIVTRVEACIKCCACVKECPIGARRFDTPYTAMLHAKCALRREPEIFM